MITSFGFLWKTLKNFKQQDKQKREPAEVNNVNLNKDIR